MLLRPARRVRIAFAVAIAALVLALVWVETSDSQRAPDKQVRTVKVTRGPLELTAAATGTFQPLEFVDVGAQLSGQLKAVKVQPGDVVRRGQVIAEIDDTTARARLVQNEALAASVRAQLAAKVAQVELARVQRDRNTRLVERGFVSVATQDAAEANLASMEAEARSLGAQAGALNAVIEQSSTELRYAQVRAPMDGVVVVLAARSGQALNAAQQAPVILRIANLASLVLVAQVSEADVVNLTPGVSARLNLLGVADRSFQGRVRKVLPSPNVVNSVVFYDVLVDVAPDPLFRIGMTAQVFFVLASHDCMMRIPRVALPADFRPPRKVEVKVLDANRAPRKLAVDVSAASDVEGGVRCEDAERAGLREGSEIVIETGIPPKGSK